MKSTVKNVFSKMLIIAGALCIAFSLGYEALHYPWLTLKNNRINELQLPDPPPPDFEYSAYDYGDTPVYTANKAAAPEELFLSLPGDSTFSTEATAEKTAQSSADQYLLLGVIKIPRINISENLFEGSVEQMKFGVGHVEGTAMPGEAGNSVLSAHRASSSGAHPFRYLDKLQNGDIVSIKCGQKTFTYTVFEMFIVGKSEVWVLAPIKDEPNLLTLITCDPAVYIGNRPNRLIVRARLTDVSTPEEPAIEDTPATNDALTVDNVSENISEDVATKDTGKEAVSVQI